MNEVFAGVTRPVQALEPVDECPLDELQEPFVPVPDDELPQGVLDLVASLIVLPRPMMEAARTLAWQALEVGPETRTAEPDGQRWEARAPQV